MPRTDPSKWYQDSDGRWYHAVRCNCYNGWSCAWVCRRCNGSGSLLKYGTPPDKKEHKPRAAAIDFMGPVTGIEQALRYLITDSDAKDVKIKVAFEDADKYRVHLSLIRGLGMDIKVRRESFVIDECHTSTAMKREWMERIAQDFEDALKRLFDYSGPLVELDKR